MTSLRAALLVMMLAAPGLVAGCVGASGDSCLKITVEASVNDAGEAQFRIDEVREGEWPLADVGYEIYSSSERGPLERGYLDRLDRQVRLNDTAPQGILSPDDVIRFMGNATEVGGLTLFSQGEGTIGGTLRCR